MKLKNKLLVLLIITTLVFLGACGTNLTQNEEIDEERGSDITGIMLAGEEPPEVVGILKNTDLIDEVVISVEGQDVTYRLSDEAKRQIEVKEVEDGSEVTFTTFSIGDEKATISQFYIK